MRPATMATLLATAGLAVGGCAGGTEYGPSGTPDAAAVAPEPAASVAETGEPEAGVDEHAGHAGHGGGESSAPASAPAEPAAAPAADDMAGMKTLATWEPGELDVQLHAMPPELFYVSEGDGLRPQRPTSKDDTHLMVTLADKESGVRLPDATVTLRLTDADGGTAFEGPLYPMVGRGMGLHYGENVDVGQKGDYEAALTIGPPRVGRHRAVAEAWTKTTTVRQKVTFDGKSFTPR